MPLRLVPPRPGRSPYWRVRGTHLGIYLDRSTGLVSEAKAAAQLRLWRSGIERGALSAAGEMSFLDAAEAYVRTGGDGRFLGNFDAAARAWTGLLAELGDLPLSAVDQAAIDRAALRLHPAATAATRNRQVYTPISAVLKYAGREFKIRRPKGWRGAPRGRYLQKAEAFALLRAARRIDTELGLFLTVMLYTGLRLGEATRGLRCEALDLREAWAFIARTKNGAPRTVFLPAPAVAALGNHPAGLDREGPVFRFRKNGRLYSLFRRARAAAGLGTDVTFHTFRHTYGAWMRRYGGLDTAGLVATGAWRDRASAAVYEHVDVTAEARKAALLPVERRGRKRG